jgi:hypothetical protein
MIQLSDYIKGVIIARTRAYNTDLARLTSNYQTQINAVNANATLSRGNKMRRVNAIRRAEKYAIFALKYKYMKDIAMIKKTKKVPVVQRNTPANVALLVGINYIGTLKQLYGCINDANLMRGLLISKYAYNSSNISLITDNTEMKPTRANIIEAFTDLLKYSISGDKLFFFYSGHGTQRPDRNNPNPLDKIAECIYPLDGNVITDVTFKSIIDANMKPDVSLTAIFDCCFSGTIMNLKHNYLYDNFENTWGTTINDYDSPTNGTVVCISGCLDDQLSEDALINGKFNGALTWALSTAINSANETLTWAELMENTRSNLATSEFTQLPQFSADESDFNMNGDVAF